MSEMTAEKWIEPVVPGVDIKKIGQDAQFIYGADMRVRTDDMLAILHHFGLVAARLAAVEGENEQLSADLDEASAMLGLKNEMAFRGDDSGVHAPSYRTVIDSQQREIVRLKPDGARE
jgi:hypothetical protein